eukprot:6471180-Amphidinium_carterae.1
MHEARSSAQAGADKWKQWALEAVTKGAQKAHRWAKRGRLQHDAQGHDGEPLMDLAGLRCHEQLWWDLWKQHTLPQSPLLAVPAPEICVQKLSSVLARYPTCKSPGCDGWNLRTWSLLPVQYTTRLKDVLQLWEREAVLPPSLTTMVALIPKPESTEVRPVAKTAGLLRAWSKLRREDAARWEQAALLPAHWSGPDKGCQRAMWEHSVRIQAARARGQAALSLFLDLKKFFDCVGHTAMRDALEESGFPTYLWRSCAALYAGPRCIEWNRCVGKLDTPTGTVLPGCAIASAVVKVLLLPLLKYLASAWPFVHVTSVFDDLGMESTGHPTEIGPHFVQAARYTVSWLAERGLNLNPQKSYILSSDSHLRSRVRKDIGEDMLVEAMSARQLGVVAQCGRLRRVWLHNKKQGAALKKLARLRRLRKARAPIAHVIRAGPTAGLVWGTKILGWSSSSMNGFRNQCARAQFSVPKTANPALFLAAHPAARTWDAAHGHHRAVVGRWATSIWRQEAPPRCAMGCPRGRSSGSPAQSWGVELCKRRSWHLPNGVLQVVMGRSFTGHARG